MSGQDSNRRKFRTYASQGVSPKRKAKTSSSGGAIHFFHFSRLSHEATERTSRWFALDPPLVQRGAKSKPRKRPFDDYAERATTEGLVFPKGNTAMDIGAKRKRRACDDELWTFGGKMSLEGLIAEYFGF